MSSLVAKDTIQYTEPMVSVRVDELEAEKQLLKVVLEDYLRW